jgi:hypothetical protein
MEPLGAKAGEEILNGMVADRWIYGLEGCPSRLLQHSRLGPFQQQLSTRWRTEASKDAPVFFLITVAGRFV